MVISIADMPEEEHFKRHFGSDQSVWRDGDWNGFVRIAVRPIFLLEDLVFYDSSAGIKGDSFFM